MNWDLKEYWSPEIFIIAVRAGTLIFLALPITYGISRWLQKYIAKKYTAQQGMIAGKALLYTGILFIVISLLNEFGFKLTHLLAAAGVAGIAIGFAAQTSVSNIISGFFLMAEQPFVVEDVITVGSTTGVVISIDMLSVKLRTFDNKLIRVPNEMLLKSEVTNITHFPIRRVDIDIGISYREDVGRVREVLLDIAQKNPLSLQEPEPLIIFKGFGDSSVNLFFGVWAEKSDWLKVKNSMQEEIKNRFKEEGIEIPFPQRDLHIRSSQPVEIKSST